MSIMEPRVFCIVAVYNRKATTLKFVDTIRRQFYSATQLVVVDDVSTDGTYESLEDIAAEWAGLTVLRTSGNAWWGGCMYLAIEHILTRLNPVDQDLILFMNDDISFDEKLVESFVEAAKQKPDSVLAATPLHGTRIRSIGSSMISWPLAIPYTPYRGEEVDKDSIPEFIPIDFQYGHATAYPVKIIRTIGNVAYQQLPHYHGDGEYSYRAKRHGFKSFVVKSIRLYPDTQDTGLFNSTANRHSFSELWKSFTAFKSINNVKHRWEFAKLSCPLLWRPMYFCSEILKATLRSVTIILWSDIRSIFRSRPFKK